MGTVVVEWAYENGVTVVLIEVENIVGTTIGLDGEMASKVTVGRACGLVGVNDYSINAVDLGRKG